MSSTVFIQPGTQLPTQPTPCPTSCPVIDSKYVMPRIICNKENNEITGRFISQSPTATPIPLTYTTPFPSMLSCYVQYNYKLSDKQVSYKTRPRSEFCTLEWTDNKKYAVDYGYIYYPDYVHKYKTSCSLRTL